jgi:D-glycero-alpha-D-manno-heptose 1-phosphate guanylyltransferase
MNTKVAIVLAGGLGTRLQGVLPGIPKCMAPVQGKPFLTYVLDYLIHHHINKVILSVGYRNDQIINYFSFSYRSASIEYSIENEPLGTGGAVKLACSRSSKDTVIVINGDTYFTPDLKALEDAHTLAGADITIAVKQMPETGRYGLVKFNKEGRIIEFSEKDHASGKGWINGGIYLINRQIFETIPQKRFSLENDVFKLACDRLHMHAFTTDAFFLDMGIPEDFERAQTMIIAKG